jgi:hypothetical protein
MYDVFNLYSLYKGLKDYLEEEILKYESYIKYYREKIKETPSDSPEYDETIVNFWEMKGIYKGFKNILGFLEELEKEYLKN